MDRLNRRDVGVASAIGGALVVATLAVGQLFGGPGTTAVEGPGPSGAGGAIVVAGGEVATGGRGARDRSTDPGASVGRPGGARGASSRSRSSSAGSEPARAPSSGRGAGRASGTSTGRGSGSVTEAVDEAGASGTPGPAPERDGSSAGAGLAPGGEADGATGGDDRLTTAAVRLDVTDLSVTGTDSGTLRSGSEVRVRMATTRETLPTGADTVDVPAVGTSAAGAGDGSAGTSGVGSAASGVADGLPGRLDVRIRLDDAAIAALDATAPGATGPVALRALVDLVERPTAPPPSSSSAPSDTSSAPSDTSSAPGAPSEPDGASPDGEASTSDGPPSTEAGSSPAPAAPSTADDSGRYAARIRLQLTSADGARASVSDAPRTTDGVSNVVAVTTPIGTPSPDAAPEAPTGDVPPARPVEVRVPVPTTTATTSPEDGGSVGIPIPDDAGSPAGGPSTAEAAVVVHVPADGEPIGGTPEDLTPTTPPAPSDGTADVPGADGATQGSGGPEAGVDEGATSGDGAGHLDDVTVALGTLLTSAGR